MYRDYSYGMDPKTQQYDFWSEQDEDQAGFAYPYEPQNRYGYVSRPTPPWAWQNMPHGYLPQRSQGQRGQGRRGRSMGMGLYGRGESERGRRGRGVRLGVRRGVGGGRGMSGGLTEGFFQQSQEILNAQRERESFGNVYNNMENVVCVENVDEDVCEIGEEESGKDDRNVKMSETGMSITVPRESDRQIKDKQGDAGEEEGSLKADEREAAADGEASQASQTRQLPSQAETQARTHTLAAQASSSLQPQTEPSQLSTGEKVIEAREAREATVTATADKQRGADNSSAVTETSEVADHSVACAARDKSVEGEGRVTRDGEKVEEERTNEGQIQGDVQGLIQGEGRGEDGGKAKQKENTAKGARLSLGGKGDAGASAARKLAQFKAVERKEKGGGDKGGKLQKKDGSGVGSMTTRSHTNKR